MLNYYMTLNNKLKKNHLKLIVNDEIYKHFFFITYQDRKKHQNAL